MITKTFTFSRIEKSSELIEKKLNDFLEKHDFKYAVQNESAIKGKMAVSLFCNEKPGKVRAKVFKDGDFKNIDEDINTFLEKNAMKFVTQSFIGSTALTIIFYTNKTEDNE